MAVDVDGPFVGLVPYEEDDARFFFGRERETRLVVANLFASRLTLLYGASGVGKSSLLRAGVLAELARREARAIEQGEQPEQVAVYLKDWQGDVLPRFRRSLATALASAFPELEDTGSEEKELAELLVDVCERLDVDLLVILDQFEEYFLYHGDETVDDEPFARQLAAAVNAPALPVSFLLVLRDDSLARLDRFKERVPRLFSNYLRLRPLSEAAARRAITEPVRVFNELLAGNGGPVEVELALVDAVVEQVRRGRVRIDEGGLGGAESAEAGIEAPFLQLVMSRVWDEEVGAGSRTLRARTLADLGDAATIVRGHLDRVMGELSDEERRICARIFQHLVTPSGTKIAHTAADLAQIAAVEPRRMERLLARISGSETRVLAPVAPVDAVGEVRYEIFHDALAHAMLEWRRRHVEERERLELEKEAEMQRQALEKERRAAWRLRWLAAGLAVFMVLALMAMGAALMQWRKARENEELAKRASLEVSRQRDEAQQALQARDRALDALQEEERQRLKAEAERADSEGDVERATQLRDEAERLRQESERRARELEDLLPTRDEEVEALRRERDQERSRADNAENTLAQTTTELETARETIARLRSTNDLPRARPYEVAGLEMKFRIILSKTFLMGSPQNENGRGADETERVVDIQRDFWIAETEVTQEQWRELIGNNPSEFQKCGADCPVENVNWFDAVAYANRLSEREELQPCYQLEECRNSPGKDYECKSVTFVGLDCEGYRLPTEAEWELAARAGTKTPFSTGKRLSTKEANFAGDIIRPPLTGAPPIAKTKGTTAARDYPPNDWGLYDMHGNVWEWVHDWYGFYSKNPIQDRGGPKQGAYRVHRGGSWFRQELDCRSAKRAYSDPGSRSGGLGFRLARTYVSPR